MEERCIENTCNFMAVKPIMADLPYPPIRVQGKNRSYADLLKVDYCGQTSELSAITQYINNENRLSGEKCAIAQTLLGIGMAEMIHLQKLGEMIVLLGGDVDYTVPACNGRQKMWTPAYVAIPGQAAKMLTADLEAERAAIAQYEAHIRMIGDDCVNAVLARIIRDEEYHIMLLKALMQA